MSRNILYWSVLPPYKMSDREFDGMWLDPQPISDRVKRFREKNSNFSPEDYNFIKCPVFNMFAKKTFNLLSPVDYSICINDKGCFSEHYDQFFFERYIGVRNLDLNLISFRIAPYIFFSETPCKLTLSNSFFSDEDFSMYTEVIPGTIEVSRWFRNLDLAFYIKIRDKQIKISRNDPLCGIHVDFGNNDTIVLKKFAINEILDRASRFHNVKHVTFNNRPNFKNIMEYFYSMFDSSSNKKIILKEIKNNLVE